MGAPANVSVGQNWYILVNPPTSLSHQHEHLGPSRSFSDSAFFSTHLFPLLGPELAPVLYG